MKPKRHLFPTRLFMSLFTVLCSIGAWAQGLSGSGSYTDPYLITSTDDWNTFAEGLAAGTYSYKYVRLENDITVNTMMGMDADHMFNTIFWGNNKTLTVNIVNNDPDVEYVAPFRYFNGKIYDLTVAGTITSAGQYAGGIVGISHSWDVTLENCVVTATITTSADYAGGFVGRINDSKSTIFKNCVFAGTIQSSNSDQHKAGGFYGYTYFGQPEFTNCLEKGTYSNISLMNPRGVDNNDNFSGTVNSFFYFNTIGEVNNITEANNCFRVQSTAPAQGFYQACATKGYSFYLNASILGLMDTYLYNNGNVVSLGYTLKAATTTLTEGTDYEVTIRDNNNNNTIVLAEDLKAVGDYTVTFAAKAGNTNGLSGQVAFPFSIVQDGESLDGYVFTTEGTGDEKVYLIKDATDLERLAAYVNTGHNASGLTFKLNDEINMTGVAHTAIGLYDVRKYTATPFCGTFDGNKKAITNLTINKPSEHVQGLFGSLGEGAVVKDLTLSSCDITALQYAGGIVAVTKGKNNNHVRIENCHVNGAIKATNQPTNTLLYHGGIAGSTDYTEFTNCTVTGTISTTVSNGRLGGIIGYAGQGVYATNCHNAASVTGSGSGHGGIAGDASGNMYHFTNCLNTGVVEGTEEVAAIIWLYYDWNNLLSNCYYASPCTVSAFGDRHDDVAGEGERAYSITQGNQLSNLTVANASFASEYAIDGKNYCKAGTYTLTLTPTVPQGSTFVSYTCEGGTLTNLTTADGEHTLTVSDQEVVINATVRSANATDITSATIDDIPDQLWLGKVDIKPAVTVTLGNNTLVKGTDYVVEYTDNQAVGTATATVRGINDYQGTITKEFTIVTFAGDGTSSNPYQITNEADLKALASIVNSGVKTGKNHNGYDVYGYDDQYLEQTKDITLTQEHIAIGSSNYTFKGTFDGKNYSISGLVINKPDAEYQGLFGNSWDATFQNVNIVNCDITAGNDAGGVVGRMHYGNRVENCKVSGAIKVADGKSANNHGGIVGYTDNGATIKKCVNTASVTGNGTYHGGIVGSMSGSISDCFNAGTVEGTSYVGSIAGSCSATLTKNYHTKETTGGVGAKDVTTGTDRTGAEVAVKITAAEDVTLTPPATPSYSWNNENLYCSGTEVELDYAVPQGKFFNIYTVNSGEISNNGIRTGKHVLTGFTADVVISATTVDSQSDISETAVMADTAPVIFNGLEQPAEPVITYNNETLVKNTNYALSYTKDGVAVSEVKEAGDYKVTATFLGAYTGSIEKPFTIIPFDISAENAVAVNGIETEYPQTGSAVHPVPASVKCAATNNATLVLDTDYELSYSEGCTLPGNYQVTVTGKGNYTGTKAVGFAINTDWILTVHDGTTTNDFIPLYGFYAYNYQKHEFVMPATELSAMNGRVIHTMKFYLSNKANNVWNGTFQVFLKEVDFSACADDYYNQAFSGTEGATIVYEGSLDGTHDIMTITFTTPYLYNGGNLLVGIYKTTKDNYSIASFYGESTSYYASYNYYDSSSLENITAGNKRKFLPKTTFLYAPENVSIKMNQYGIMTYASPYALDFGNATIQTSNATALTASYASEFTTNNDNIGTLTLTPATQVPAGEGLMLKGTAGATYSVPVITSAAALSPANLMVGLTEATTVSQKQTIDNVEYTSFILANGTSGINWYLLADDSYNTLKANSAYLRLASSVVGSARQIVMEFDEASGIKSIDNGKLTMDNEEWYSVDGVKLNNQPTRKGLYIINGKKVVIK